MTIRFLTLLSCVVPLVALTSIARTAAAGGGQVETVSYVDLQRYAGTWYEIASKPQPFQRGCSCTQASYSLLKSGAVGVVNRCYRDGGWDEIEGTATVVDETSQAHLQVQFPGAPPGDYLVVGLDEQYRYAVVASPANDGLWVLSREPQLEPRLLGEAVSTAAEKMDLTGLTFTRQSGCPR